MSKIENVKITEEIDQSEDGQFVEIATILTEDYSRTAVREIKIEISRSGGHHEGLGLTEYEFNALYHLLTRIKTLKDNT